MADELIHADALRIHLTGAASDGGAQADPNASLGNYRSSSEAQVLGIEIASPIANITIDYASGANSTGVGTMTATDATSLAWTPPGGAQGPAVSIADGETKLLEGGGGATEKYIRVSRTSAVALAGTATVTLSDVFNDVIGSDNIGSGEALAGDTEYRCFCLYVAGASQVKMIRVWIGTLGTQRTTDAGQLGAAGAGTIETTGSFADWPDTGYARIVDNGGTLREIVYYSSRTDTVLTVPAAGRGLLGTGAAAGAATDTVDAVPGIRIAKEAPSAQPDGFFTVCANEGVEAGGMVWNSSIASGAGLDIGDLSAGYIYAIRIQRQIPAAAVAEPSVLNLLQMSFEAA